MKGVIIIFCLVLVVVGGVCFLQFKNYSKAGNS